MIDIQSILLVTAEKDLEQFISVLLEARLPVDVVQLSSTKEAKSRLDKGMRYQMVVTDVDLTSEAGGEFFEANQKNYKLPFINIYEGDDPSNLPDFSDFFKSNKHNRVILKSKIKDRILSEVTDIHRRVTKDKFQKMKFTHNGVDLIRVKTSYFLNLDHVDSDVFIRLPSGKFLKIIAAGSEINKETLENVYRKGGEFLYQDEKSYEKLANVIFTSLSKKLKDKNLSEEAKIEAQIDSIKKVQDTVRNMGINDHIISFADDIVESVQDLVKGNRNLGKIVKKLLKHKKPYFVRSSLINYLAGGLVHEVGWDTYTTMRKLVYASVFCDFGFEVHEEPLIEIIRKDSDDFKRLSPQDQHAILEHPERAIKYLERNQGMLTDEVNIVLQHHEKPDGTGFPKGLNYNQIPPLSCAFILCHDFANELLQLSRVKEDVYPYEIFDILGPNYSKANFNKPYLALKRALN